MKYLKPVILALLIVVLSSFPTLQTKICHSGNPSSTIADNLYSSVVVITEKKLKISSWDALRFAAFVAGQAAGTGSFGLGKLKPYHTEESIGTGFQTKWGVVTNSHVMEDKTKVVLTTFHRRHYRIKKINTIKHKDKYKHIPIHEKRIYQDAKLIQTKTKEATVYDWGDMDIDMALIDVKIPGAFSLPLAKEVKIDEQVIALGHPEGKKFTPSKGRVTRIYKRGGTKYIELFIKHAGGSSGSPVMNVKGEVVGIQYCGVPGLDVAEAVHVEALRKAIGLPNNNVPKSNYSPTIKPWNEAVMKPWSGMVYATEYSHLFHKPDCSKLNTSDGLIKFDTLQKASKAGHLPCNYCIP